MSGTITVAEDQEWQVSNWAYRCLMDQVLDIVTSEQLVASFVEVAKWNHGLDIPEMLREEPEMGGLILHALRIAVQRCSDGSVAAKVDGRVLDEVSQQQFREATHELATMLSGLP